ncbi:hypothetical protein HPB48_014777 [Haemaphysalis longicornis]|uniref:Uncharacterized protein n=1 Tax=Haemaphysalis longicornis TaxID=44386 RepID=A0A9J6GW06_HAELO|nr:hypothetical protein HPB48_014777 [Haemaphysalis longicornis]
MAVVDSELRGERILVLWDTGTNTVLVRRSLVTENEFTRKEEQVVLVDGTVGCWPEANIQVSTP